MDLADCIPHYLMKVSESLHKWPSFFKAHLDMFSVVVIVGVEWSEQEIESSRHGYTLANKLGQLLR